MAITEVNSSYHNGFFVKLWDWVVQDTRYSPGPHAHSHTHLCGFATYIILDFKNFASSYLKAIKFEILLHNS